MSKIDRINHAQKQMRDKDLSLLAAIAGPDLYYLTGLDFHASERPAILLLPASGQPAFIFPDFEITKVEDCEIQVASFSYGEERATWVQSCEKALDFLSEKNMKIGVNAIQMRFLEMNLLRQANPEITFQSADFIFEELRMHKDPDEIANIRIAIHIAERAFLETLKTIKLGRTEKEIAAQLVMNLFNFGSDPQLPFSPIVASGPNAANPHALPSERQIEMGDMLIIDWGATYNHYISDITRTISIGKPDREFETINQVLKEANAYARQIAKAGIPCSQVDAAARNVITKAGYGQYFTHRTGHGIGMEAHEAPYIASDNQQKLEIGNTFTIEPGVYIPHKGGIRLEDNVAITSEGAETLTTLPRDLFIIE